MNGADYPSAYATYISYDSDEKRATTELWLIAHTHTHTHGAFWVKEIASCLWCLHVHATALFCNTWCNFIGPICIEARLIYWSEARSVKFIVCFLPHIPQCCGWRRINSGLQLWFTAFSPYSRNNLFEHIHARSLCCITWLSLSHQRVSYQSWLLSALLIQIDGV